MSSRLQGRWTCCRAGFSGGFPSFAIPLSTTLSGHWPLSGIGISPHPTRMTSGFCRPFNAGMLYGQLGMIHAGNRYLVPADHSHHLPPDEIPVEATQRQSGPHPARPDVPHVPDNRRPARRMMVGTRTTARDWQWLDDMMAEDALAAPPTQKYRRMPVSYACRRGAGRPRRGDRACRGRREGVARRLPSKLSAVPAPVSRYRRRGQAHRLTSHPPLRPRGLLSRRP
ncbi:hypothetical protein PIB30_024291 [Stylosanthes scabra]|uniref:Uncharacterized protein n=1 Tax=Stylosanthes scabra TaxID=79078 RepID=A0ABU6W9X1_9FABA|nr:hypothetical protein [Stylosanthes scabra]